MLACLIWSAVGASESGPKYGALGPKYFSSAAPRAPSCSGLNLGWNICLSPVIAGRNSCHCSEVFPRRLRMVSKLWQLMQVARIMRVCALSGSRLSISAPERRETSSLGLSAKFESPACDASLLCRLGPKPYESTEISYVPVGTE